MNTYIQPLKRCFEQRFEGRKQSSKVSTEFTKRLGDIATKMSTAAYELKDPKEIIRTALIELENARSDFNE